MTGMDWPALMKAGMQGLRLKPCEFWALTPAELGLMLGLDQSTAPLGRTRLDEMIRAFPDSERTTDG